MSQRSDAIASVLSGTSDELLATPLGDVLEALSSMGAGSVRYAVKDGAERTVGALVILCDDPETNEAAIEAVDAVIDPEDSDEEQ